MAEAEGPSTKAEYCVIPGRQTGSKTVVIDGYHYCKDKKHRVKCSKSKGGKDSPKCSDGRGICREGRRTLRTRRGSWSYSPPGGGEKMAGKKAGKKEAGNSGGDLL